MKYILALMLTLWLGLAEAATHVPPKATTIQVQAADAPRVTHLTPKGSDSSEACTTNGGCYMRNIGLAAGLSILVMTLATDAIQKLKL